MGRKIRKTKSVSRRLGIKLKKSTVFSVVSVTLVLLAVIIIFAFLHQGTILIGLNELLWRLFGFVSFLLPFIFISLAIGFSRFKTPLREPNIFTGAMIVFLSLLGLFKSGLVGFWLWDKIAILITGAGALLLFLGGVLIGVVVLFNTSLEQIFKSILTILAAVKKYTFGIKGKRKKKQLFVGEKEGKVKEEAKKGAISPSPAVLDISLPTAAARVKAWQYPSLEILRDDLGSDADRGDVNANAAIIEEALDSFGITARVTEVNRGPAVTQYALKVASGTKLSKITTLSNDLALALAAPTGQIRIEAPIPGRSLVGIEIPNRASAIVSLKEMLASAAMTNSKSKLAVPLGLDVSGISRVADLGRMPHVLVAGQTGSGKSVLLNSWIATILFRATPDEVKLILIDPKRVELSRYNDIPHLLTPVVFEPEKVVSSLKWAISEMDRRYKLFTEKDARNLEVFNRMVPEEEKFPYIIIIIDELADIMLFAPAEVEDTICRIAQMARATGIHLVLATQRPSVDVLTGLIKANIPCRISFAVASMTDSRVILDTPGAEKLLGRGDMLYIPPNQAKPTRIQGPFISDAEVKKLIIFLRQQRGTEYQKEVFSQPVAISPGTVLVNGEERDALFDEAINIIRNAGKASSSLLQRRLRIGYARAARILDQLEAAGLVGPADGSKPRKLL